MPLIESIYKLFTDLGLPINASSVYPNFYIFLFDNLLLFDLGFGDIVPPISPKMAILFQSGHFCSTANFFYKTIDKKN